MKNIFRFLCAAMLLVSFAACDDEINGNNNTPDGDDNTLAAQLVGTWQSEHILVNGEEAHMQMTITLNDNGTGKIEGMEEAFNWQVNGNDVTITLAQGNTYLYTVTNITEEILVITGTTVPGSDQEASFEGHFKKVTGDTPGTPDPGDLGIGTPELVESTSNSLTVSAHVTGSISEYLGQFPNYTCGVIYECDQELSMDHNVVTATPGADGYFTVTITGLESNKDYMVAAWLKLTPESDAIISNMRVYATGGTDHSDENWVDLGLPSGLLWAKCNLGATTPEGFGDYYAWGETQTKSHYGWSTYQYCNWDGVDDEEGTYQTMTKYNTSSVNGNIDNLTTLQAMDDAATAVLGNGARIPTKEEWEELISNTTVERVYVNSVEGRRFTAANGNTLFLPAASAWYYESYYDVTGEGHYWSSSLCTTYPYRAWLLEFQWDTHSVNHANRCYGFPVRAVRAPQN